MQIELATSPDEEDLRTISRGIESYNEEHLPHDVVYEPDTDDLIPTWTDAALRLTGDAQPSDGYPVQQRI